MDKETERKPIKKDVYVESNSNEISNNSKKKIVNTPKFVPVKSSVNFENNDSKQQLKNLTNPLNKNKNICYGAPFQPNMPTNNMQSQIPYFMRKFCFLNFLKI